MYSINIFIFWILGLLNLTKINGIIPDATLHHIDDYLDKDFNGNCKDIYDYLEGLGKLRNLNDCKVNYKGEIIELRIYPYCFDNEQLKTVLSYNTIKTLEFTKIIPNVDTGFTDYEIESFFNCTTIPTNYESLSSLNKLKSLDLTGVWNLDINVFNYIPKSVEELKIGRYKHPQYFKLNQNIIDALSKLTNLNSLSLLETEINEKLDFKNFKNLKNLIFLEIIYDSYNDSNKLIPGNIFKYCRSLKYLETSEAEFNANSIDGMGYMTKLEELEFKYSTFKDDVDFSSFKNLKNLTYLYIYCYYSNLSNISSNFFYLKNLRTFYINKCESTFHTSLKDSLTWANLKNLKYLYIYNSGIKNTDFDFLGDLPSVKEFYLHSHSYSSISENIGNLKSAEVIEIDDMELNSLPKSIGNLENLRFLSIYSGNLTSLPDEIGNLKNLEELVINSNRYLTSLPESIGNLVNLRVFEGKINGIVNLPKSIENLNITSLNLSYNKLESIPNEIGNMKNLVELYLSDNKITNIPSFLGNLEELEELDLYHNEIDDFLPESLNNLKNLRKVNFGYNIDIKGEALSSPNLIICNYSSYYINSSSKGTSYSLCRSPNSTCIADYLPMCEKE